MSALRALFSVSLYKSFTLNLWFSSCVCFIVTCILNSAEPWFGYLLLRREVSSAFDKAMGKKPFKAYSPLWASLPHSNKVLGRSESLQVRKVLAFCLVKEFPSELIKYSELSYSAVHILWNVFCFIGCDGLLESICSFQKGHTGF